MLQSSIFKSYDIRGTYPDQVNEHTAFQIGRGFVKHSGAKNVAVAHDARLSSPELFRALAEGIISQGANVHSIGQAPTECLYFAVGNYADIDGGVMVTASHNPKEYNGFKMMKKSGGNIEVIRGTDLLPAIGQNRFEELPHGMLREKDIWTDYRAHVMSFVTGGIKPFRIAVDASNGVIGPVIEKLRTTLPVAISEINFNPDGNFPNHPPNPLAPGAVNQIAEMIKNKSLDFGFIFDADADRIFLVDELGSMVAADMTLLLLAKHLLQEHTGSAIVYNVFCSKAVPEWIIRWGGEPVRTKVGFVNVREGLLHHQGIMGGETSAHYSFRDNFYMDSGIIAMLQLLQIISADGRTVSQMIRELQKYYKSPELNFEIQDKEGALEKVEERYADGRRDFLDGVTITYPDWWFCLRASNTEPLLRLTVEADTQELLDRKKAELTELLADVP